MTLTHYKALGLTVFILVSLAILGALASKSADAASFPGTRTNIATSSNPTVSATAGTLFATSTCTARVITTSASPIMLTFSDYAGQTPTGSFGHLQAASTTVEYDSQLYGCGLFKVYSFATQVITVSESRGSL